MNESLNEFLSAVSARLEAATPGPWRAECTPKGPCGQMVYADAVLGPVKYPTSDPAKFVDVEQSIIWTDQRAVPRWRETLGFIANAPADLARLVEIVKVLRDGLGKTQHAVANAWEWQCSEPEESELDRDQQIGSWCEKACDEIKEALQRADELAKENTNG